MTLSIAAIRSLPKSAIAAMKPEEREAVLNELPLAKRLNSMAANSGLLPVSGFYRTVHDFVIATVDTPEERAHIVEQVELAADKYIAPKFGGVESVLYQQMRALSLTLLDNLLTKVGQKGSTVKPVAHVTVAAAKTSFNLNDAC